jgi:DNA-directed RNA polymerase
MLKIVCIKRKAYGSTSTITGCNKIYNMVNNISDTPFKINQPLLDYLISAGTKHNLLMDPLIKHKYADFFFEKIKRSRYQERMLASYNSKVLLQETILDLAEFYKRFSKIYFPVRLDQRGVDYIVVLII